MNPHLCTDFLLPDNLRFFNISFLISLTLFKEPQFVTQHVQIYVKYKYSCCLTLGSIVLCPFLENAKGPKCITLS